mmetsp:Transcript_32766/g.86650  ORF Transcript_32766/g.86650 Transcript_32766/m.86650 type:complete len:214 (-) Transcript_32766:120-761(-)
MSEGEAQYAVVVDNGPTIEPYFNETWGACPSTMAADQQEELRTMAMESLKCCGFTTGVFHVELKYTSRGPRLIEINARMGGGQVRKTHLEVYGIDLVEETLFSCVGIPNRPPADLSRPLCALAYNYVNAPQSGRVESLAALAQLRRLPGVVYAKGLVKAGELVVGPSDGLPTWLADIMVEKKPVPGDAITSTDAEEVLQSVLALSESLSIPIR